MNGSILSACASLILITASPAELPIGTFSDMCFFPETGDVGGSELTVTKEGGRTAVYFEEAAGERLGKKLVTDLKPKDSNGTYSFTMKGFDGVIRTFDLFFFPGGAVMSGRTAPDLSSYLLLNTNAPASLGLKDSVSFAKGALREKADGKSKVIASMSSPVIVKLVKKVTADVDGVESVIGYEIICGGRQGFVHPEGYLPAHAAAITGDKVRFREKPSTDAKILREFSRGTIVGRVMMYDVKWTLVIYDGAVGYVANDFITSN